MDEALTLALLDSPVLQRYLSAFLGTTGIFLRYLPAEMPRTELSQALQEDPLMMIIMLSRKGEIACVAPILALSAKIIYNLKPRESSSVCGLTHFGVPLVLAGSAVGMLLAGPITPKILTPKGSDRMGRRIINLGSKLSLRSISAAYGAVPIVSSKRLESTIALLSILASQLATERWLLSGRECEPSCVTAAKRFIRNQALRELPIDEIARHVYLSADHIGKIFKKHTHMTMGQYLAGVRVEHVKDLLAKPSNRVIDTAFAAGFRSLAQFNRIFKDHVGVNPTQYRAGCGDAGKRAAIPGR